MIRTLIITTAFWAAFWAAHASPAAACSKAHQSPFELFELSETVAIVKVTAVPAKGAGTVDLAVKRILKGDAKATALTAEETNTSCHVGFRAGRTALVFLTATGSPAGRYEGYREAMGSWPAVLDAWRAAKDADGRVAVLIDAITGTEAEISEDAGYFLADRPDLLVHVDAKQRAAILATAKQAPKRSALPLVLARLREPAALDIKSQYHDLAAGLLGVTRFETETDPAKLADAIAGGTGAKDPDRIAATERCERVRGMRIYRFEAYVGGVADQFWPTLAKACRTGVPASP